jgi:hypothetical protein
MMTMRSTTFSTIFSDSAAARDAAGLSMKASITSSSSSSSAMSCDCSGCDSFEPSR